MGCQHSAPSSSASHPGGGFGGGGGRSGSGSASGSGSTSAPVERLAALRLQKQRDRPKPPPPPPIVDEGTGRLLPSEVGKRTVTSQASRLVRLGGLDHAEGEEILVEYAHWTQRGFYPEDPHKENQDALGVHLNFAGSGGAAWMAVYDGHGPSGGDCARFASKRLPALLSKKIEEAAEKRSRHRNGGGAAQAADSGSPDASPDAPPPPLLLSPEECRACLRDSYVETNAAMHRSIVVESQLSGTTAIGVLFHRGHVTVANCGDSRAVLGRKRRPSDPPIGLATLRYQRGRDDPASTLDGTLSSRDDDPPRLRAAVEIDGGPVGAHKDEESTTAWALDLDHHPNEGGSESGNATESTQVRRHVGDDRHPEASESTAWGVDLDDSGMFPDASESTAWRLDLDDHGVAHQDESESTAWRLDLDDHDAEPPRIEPVPPTVPKKPDPRAGKAASSEHPFDENRPLEEATAPTISSADMGPIRTADSFGLGKPSDEDSTNDGPRDATEATDADFSEHADPAAAGGAHEGATPHLDEALAVARGLTDLVHGKSADADVMGTLRGLSDLMDAHEAPGPSRAAAPAAKGSEPATNVAEGTATAGNDGKNQRLETTSASVADCGSAKVDDGTAVDAGKVSDAESRFSAVGVAAGGEGAAAGEPAKGRAAEAKAGKSGGKAKSQPSFVAVPLSRDQTPWRQDERDRVKEAGACVWSIDQIEGRVPFHDDWGDSFEGDTTQDFYQDPPRLWIAGKEYPGTAFTRSLGDWFAESVGVIAEPEMLTLELTSNDQIVVIASDGVFEFLTNQEVINICAESQSPLEACGNVVRAAYEQWHVYESRSDDISIIVCFMKCSRPPVEGGKGTSDELLGVVNHSECSSLTQSQTARYARGISIVPLSDGVKPSVEEALADLSRDNPRWLHDGASEEGSC